MKKILGKSWSIKSSFSNNANMKANMLTPKFQLHNDRLNHFLILETSWKLNIVTCCPEESF